jgi:uncharacterized protein
MMKTLSVLGTAAMFMVGGSILTHGIPAAHHLIEAFAHRTGALAPLVSVLGDAVFGILAGAVVLLGVTVAGRVARSFRKAS